MLIEPLKRIEIVLGAINVDTICQHVTELFLIKRGSGTRIFTSAISTHSYVQPCQNRSRKPLNRGIVKEKSFGDTGFVRKSANTLQTSLEGRTSSSWYFCCRCRSRWISDAVLPEHKPSLWHRYSCTYRGPYRNLSKLSRNLTHESSKILLWTNQWAPTRRCDRLSHAKNHLGERKFWNPRNYVDFRGKHCHIRRRGVVVHRLEVIVRATFQSPEMHGVVGYIDVMYGLPRMLKNIALITNKNNSFFLHRNIRPPFILICRRPFRRYRISFTHLWTASF